MPSPNAVILTDHCRYFYRFLRTNPKTAHDNGSGHPVTYFSVLDHVSCSMVKGFFCFRITFEWKQVIISHSCKIINSPACEKIESKRNETNVGYKINLTVYKLWSGFFFLHTPGNVLDCTFQTGCSIRMKKSVSKLLRKLFLSINYLKKELANAALLPPYCFPTATWMLCAFSFLLCRNEIRCSAVGSTPNSASPWMVGDSLPAQAHCWVVTRDLARHLFCDVW